MLLSIERLKVETAARKASAPLVDNISLSLEAGEVAGIIGELGAGKLTLGLAALGHARNGCCITAGSVVFDGTNLLLLSKSDLLHLRGRRMAYVAQSAAAAFNPAHRLIAQICEVPVREGMMSRESARSEAVALFRRLGLPDPERFGERYPYQVSGGQLQRAMIAMAMICRPQLLVLDEPTTALDVTTQIEVLAHLRSLIREDGLAALYITHDLALVLQLATRILVLRHGAAVESGAAETIITRAESPYTRALVAAQRRTIARRAPHPRQEVPLLELTRLRARYASGPLVLEDIDLEVLRGETLALVGESGSGKSSLARVVVGLLPKCDGIARYKGQELPVLRDRSRNLCREIQLVHQVPDLALNPRQRVKEIIGRPIKLFRSLRARDKEPRVAELLDLVGLEPALANRFPHELSGGQKQRVCIARALAADPELLICDEVTAALDAVVATEVLDLLDSLQKRLGMACLLITHDFGVVKAMADRVAVLKHGRLVEQGSCAAVLETPRSDYTARLVAAVPELRVGWLDAAISIARAT